MIPEPSLTPVTLSVQQRIEQLSVLHPVVARELHALHVAGYEMTESFLLHVIERLVDFILRNA